MIAKIEEIESKIFNVETTDELLAINLRLCSMASDLHIELCDEEDKRARAIIKKQLNIITMLESVSAERMKTVRNQRFRVLQAFHDVCRATMNKEEYKLAYKAAKKRAI